MAGSPERRKLLEASAPLVEEFHARVVRTGFEQWFPGADPVAAPAVWKQNTIVLLLLYPVVFLFGLWVQTPLLIGRIGLPFWFALFIGNVISVVLVNWLVPWTSRGFGWWLSPLRDPGGRISVWGGADRRALRRAAARLLEALISGRAAGTVPACCDHRRHPPGRVSGRVPVGLVSRGGKEGAEKQWCWSPCRPRRAVAPYNDATTRPPGHSSGTAPIRARQQQDGAAPLQKG